MLGGRPTTGELAPVPRRPHTPPGGPLPRPLLTLDAPLDLVGPYTYGDDTHPAAVRGNSRPVGDGRDFVRAAGGAHAGYVYTKIDRILTNMDALTENDSKCTTGALTLITEVNRAISDHSAIFLRLHP